MSEHGPIHIFHFMKWYVRESQESSEKWRYDKVSDVVEMLPKTCPRYAQDMPKIYPRFAQDMPEICQRNMQKKKLGQNVHYFYKIWGKMSLGQNVSGAKCPWGKMSPSNLGLGDILI